MNVGLIGTGAIARLHAQVYRNIGYTVRVYTDATEEKGRRFAQETGAAFVSTMREVCAHPGVDFVDVCTLPGIRLEPVQLCATFGRHVQVQKPIATTVSVARAKIRFSRSRIWTIWFASISMSVARPPVPPSGCCRRKRVFGCA